MLLALNLALALSLFHLMMHENSRLRHCTRSARQRGQGRFLSVDIWDSQKTYGPMTHFRKDGLSGWVSTLFAALSLTDSSPGSNRVSALMLSRSISWLAVVIDFCLSESRRHLDRV